MEGYVKQTALPLRQNFRQTFNGSRIQLKILSHKAQTPFKFGDQHSPVRQKSHGPGICKARHQSGHTERVFFGFED